MTAIHVAYHDGAHRCYVTETGRDRRYVGCGHLSPRSAIEHSDRLATGLSATRSGDDSHGPVGSERTGRRQSGSPDLPPLTGSGTPAPMAHESPRDANPQTPVRSGSRLGDLPLQPGFGS